MVLAAKYTVVVFCCNAHATGCVTLHMDDAIESHVMVQQLYRKGRVKTEST